MRDIKNTVNIYVDGMVGSGSAFIKEIIKDALIDANEKGRLSRFDAVNIYKGIGKERDIEDCCLLKKEGDEKLTFFGAITSRAKLLFLGVVK